VRQYAATPYATVSECVECGRPLLAPRSMHRPERPRPGRARSERPSERPLAELRA
jgi:hypothetical protein